MASTRAARWVAWALVGGSVLSVAAGGDRQAESPQTAQNARINARWDQLGLLVGHWRGSAGEERFEEVWLPTEGNAMAGLYRETKGGKLALTEIETIAQEGEQITLRLRHFNGPELGPWGGEKDAPMTLNLETAETGHLVFRAPPDSRVDAIDYRLGDGNQLTVTVSFRGGRAPVNLVMTRQKG